MFSKIKIHFGIIFLLFGFILTLTLASQSILPEVQPAKAALDGAASGLAGHWKFDEGGGTTASDSSGNGNAGTLTGSPTWATGADAKIGTGALQFDGVDDYVNVGLTGNLGQKVTVSTWVNFINLVGHDRDVIFGSKYWTNGEFVFEQHSVSGLLMFTSGAGHYVQWAPGFSIGQWYHVVVVVDTTEVSNIDKVKLYFDGVLQDQVAFGGVTDDSIVATTPVKIGGALPGPGVVSFFSGSVDDTRIYNRALSGAEIAELYALGSGGGFVQDTTAPFVPTNLSSSNTTKTATTVTWSASTDATGVTGYRIYRNGTELTTTTNTPHTHPNPPTPVRPPP